MNKIITSSVASQMADDYTSYSVATANRAIPSAIDGLKLSHRRILQVCLQGNYIKWVKTARIAGEVMGNLHPHSDSSGVIQGLADVSSYLNPLVELHGNCGGYSLISRQKISNDNPAAGRYTESRLSAFGLAVFDILDLDLLRTRPSYDGTQLEISEFVPALPLALINAQSGIGTGYATNTIGFPVKQIIKALETGNPANLGCPDLPYSSNIIKNQALIDLLTSGSSCVQSVGSWTIDYNYKLGKKSTREALIITKLGGGNAEQFIEQIKNNVENGKLEGIAAVEDQTSADIKVVIVCKKDTKAESLLPALMQHTNLKFNNSIKFTLINRAQGALPRNFTPMEILEEWRLARLDILLRKYTRNLLLIDQEISLTSGILSVFSNLRDIALLIMESESGDQACHAIVDKYKVTTEVAEAILEIKLKKLVKLSKVELEKKLAELEEQQAELQKLTNDSDYLSANLIILAKQAAKHCCQRISEVIEDTFNSKVIETIAQPKEIPVGSSMITTRRLNKETKKYFDKKSKEWSYCKSIEEVKQAIVDGRGSLEDFLIEEAIVKSTYVTKRKAVKFLTERQIKKGMREGKLASEIVREFLKLSKK